MGYKVVAVVGARPNYMKVAPVWRALDKRAHVTKALVHTGQHYDDNMSKIFFDELRLPKPDIYLGVGSGTHAAQTAKIMVEMESALTRERPDLVIVVGDVNSTMATALVAAKIGIRIAHVEAGLRSFDREMPEEINRMVTDILADFLFTTEPSAKKNLLHEGVEKEKIHFVGNVMIDSLMFYRPMAEKSTILADLGLEAQKYGLVTLHRPTNVDDPSKIEPILAALADIGTECPLVFPAHPRTKKMLEQHRIHVPEGRLRIIEPVGYLEFVKLMVESRILFTDSGGIQEETTVLGIPCLTVRENTERPITVDVGTNRIVGTDPKRILAEGRRALSGKGLERRIPELWDGNAAERIVEIIDKSFL
jgi:UDP-N-acetylglucosamine 2-epimerase (non-hydrolysing)